MPFFWYVLLQKVAFQSANQIIKLRSLKYVLLPENSTDERGTMQTVARSQKSLRTQFLFGYSYVVQLFFMWLLTKS